MQLLAHLYSYSWNPFYESYLDSEHIRMQAAFAEQFNHSDWELKQKISLSLTSRPPEFWREGVYKEKHFLTSREERETASVKYIY